MGRYHISATGTDEETGKAREYLRDHPLNGEKLAECYKRLIRQEAKRLQRKRLAGDLVSMRSES